MYNDPCTLTTAKNDSRGLLVSVSSIDNCPPSSSTDWELIIIIICACVLGVIIIAIVLICITIKGSKDSGSDKDIVIDTGDEKKEKLRYGTLTSQDSYTKHN